MAQVNQPNDRVFRKALSDLRVARALLRQRLPPEMLQVIDLSCLETCKENYIEADFCSVTTDILFKTQIKQRSGYVYLLLEHQSKPDKLMPFRLLRYMVNIIQDHLSRHQREQSIILPVVLPVVFYNGHKKYPYSMNFFDLFGAQKEWIKNIFLDGFQ